MRKNPEKSEKGIDKVEKKWYNNKAVGESVKQKQSSSQGWKKLEKSLEKPLDKPAAKWYNKQAVDRKVTAKSLIENWTTIRCTKFSKAETWVEM